MNVGARVRANKMTVGVAAGLLVTLALAVAPDVVGGSVATSYVPVQTTLPPSASPGGNVSPATPTPTPPPPPVVYTAADGSKKTCENTDAGSLAMSVKCENTDAGTCAVTAGVLDCAQDMEPGASAGAIAVPTAGKCAGAGEVVLEGMCFKPCPAGYGYRPRAGYVAADFTCRWSGKAKP